MMITVEMPQLEAAATLSLLADAAQIAKQCGHDTQQELYSRIARRFASEIRRSRIELSEAELL